MKMNEFAEILADIIVFCFKLFWFCIIYSPFTVVGFYTYSFFKLTILTHWSVSAIAGLLAGGLLYMLVAFSERFVHSIRKKGSKSWLVLRIINIALVCGLPFFIGGTLAIQTIGKENLKQFEQIIVFSFSGLFIAAFAYLGVIGKLKKWP